MWWQMRYTQHPDQKDTLVTNYNLSDSLVAIIRECKLPLCFQFHITSNCYPVLLSVTVCVVWPALNFLLSIRFIIILSELRQLSSSNRFYRYITDTFVPLMHNKNIKYNMFELNNMKINLFCPIRWWRNEDWAILHSNILCRLILYCYRVKWFLLQP